MKALILLRQMDGHRAVATAVVTEATLAKARQTQAISEFDQGEDSWMRGYLEGMREAFCTKFVEYRQAEWFVDEVELPDE